MAASLLWLIAIIGVRHCRDTPVLHTAAAMSPWRDAASWASPKDERHGKADRAELVPDRMPAVLVAGHELVDTAGRPIAGASISDLPGDSNTTDTTGYFRAIRPGAGPVRLAAVTRTGAPPTTEVELARGDMPTPAGSGFATLECPERAYDLADLDRVAKAGLADLMSLIPVQAEPLRAFVRSSYPRPSGVEIPYECFSRGGLVSSLVANNFLSEVEFLHDRIAREPATTIDLFIKSSPPGGSYVLRSIHTDVGRVENTTNSPARAYRGIYDFSIIRAGYKPAHLHNIDLIDSTPRLIECQLKTTKDADESTCQCR